MHHHHRITLWVIVMGFVVGFQPGAQAQSPDKLAFALHVTTSPSWFDPAEAPAKSLPLASSMRSMTPWSVLCQESAWLQPWRPPGPKAPMGVCMN